MLVQVPRYTPRSPNLVQYIRSHSCFSPQPPPPTVVGPTTKKATRPTIQLPRSLINGARVEKKEKVYTMKEIGLEGQGISPVAASEPFPLFTIDAIKQIRAEMFCEPVLENCQYASSFASNMIRGMGRARAPFTCDAWSSLELLSKISEVAGVDLVVAFDYEIANINISADDPASAALHNGDNTPDNEPPAFSWHYDSFPFVCVTMLSDFTGMIGGETAIKTPSGEIKKIRGPAMGTAVIMQGRYIEHQALKALGGRERISMVTPFRPRSPFIRDELVLTGSRAISNWSELYTGYTAYRLELLEERFRAKLNDEKQRQSGKHRFSISDMVNFLTEQKGFLETTIAELTEVEDMD
ncbi:hypothetical protein BDV23DRAFT_176060 [Aspergillus alliaceus]|uniref:Fe2OG dioxygenase domain-containing protein n=1 Tax=Petromyces alliaceus TaxID=209559 RepID=A0A5N7BW56_PETAA|nr:hypothetical protein BDV23DRAFT_176060 [Aspergillus alliaceus]